VAALALMGALTALLPACGSSVVDQLEPTRILSVGDGMADVGQNGYQFTVNDGSRNWTQILAANFGLTLSAASAGGWSYAQGHARVERADATSGLNAPSVKNQIDALLARIVFEEKDLVLVGGGLDDIVDAVTATGISDATTQTVRAAGRALGAQVRRLVEAGAPYVVVSGVYNLGHSPWARERGQAGDIERLSTAFNDALLLSITDLSQHVLYVDAALFFNLIYNNQYTVSNVDDPACTTPTAATCTPETIVAGASYGSYMFADKLYFTPGVQGLFANDGYDQNAYTRIRDRW
jgi:phospholipase/lecithinase/hemolysin